jgi:hypothetical protein
LKHCKKCDKTKPLSEFHRNTGNADGLQTSCKICQGEAQRRNRARNRSRNATASASPAPPPVPEEFEIVVEEPALEALRCAPLDDEPTTADDRKAIAEAKADSSSPPSPADPLASAYQAVAEQTAKRDLKREHGALVEENTRLKAELDEVRRANRPPEVIVYRQPAWERSDAVSCAIASDWHVDEPVEGEAVHGLNEYSLEIARARSEHFFKNWLRLTDILARESKITTMFLAALGDTFSGWIHEELLATTQLAPGDAARFVKGLFISGIEYILRESSYTIEGVMIPGNHGRMTHKVHLGDPTGTSLETVMYEGIADRFHGNPRVRLEVSDHAMRYRRFFERFNLRLIHGYEVKYGGGIGGITIPIRKALAQWNSAVRADLTVMGHFHQFLDGGDFLVNGSLIGYNAFAQAIKASYEEARQAFFLIDARKGGQKSIVAPIWLDDAHKARKGEP